MGKKWGNAKKVTIDDITFDSKLEAKRYQELKLLEAAGKIHLLAYHPKYDLTINDMHIGVYTADFEYCVNKECTKLVIEEVKGYMTAGFPFRWKVIKACLSIYTNLEFRLWPERKRKKRKNARKEPKKSKVSRNSKIRR